MLQSAVTSQPGLGVLQPIPVYVSPKGVMVRTMVVDDSEFAGRCLIDAFSDKFIYTIGTQNMQLAREAAGEDHRRLTFKYHRIFIAEFEGQRAGVMELKFHGDRKESGDHSSDRWNALGCCPACRLGCMMMLIDENSVKRGHCYLDRIGVDERFRGKGVGTALMAVADQQARAEGCQTLYLYVASDNRAQNLYSREGFQTTDSTSVCCMASCITGRRGFLKMEKRL